MQESSYVLMFLTWIKNVFKSSAIYKIISDIMEKISKVYGESRFKKLLCGKGDIEDYSESSWFYKIIKTVLKPVFFVLKKAADFSEKSFFFETFRSFCRKSLIIDNVFDIPFVCFLIFVVPHDMWNNMYALLAAFVIFFMAAFKRAQSRDENIKVWLLVFMFFMCCAFACVTSYGRSDSIRVFMFFVSAFVLCVGIYMYISDKEKLDKFIKWMFAAVFVTAVIAFVQRAMGIEADELLADMELNAGMPGRAFSTMGNPNNYAEFLMLFLPFAFAYAVTRKNVLLRVCLMGGVMVSIGALILTYSRSGWIAFAFALVVYVMLYNKKLLPVLVILAIAAVPFLPQSVLNRILTIGNMKDTSSAYRINIWTGCLKMIKDYWITGVGLGSAGFMTIYPKYSIVNSATAPHSHMQFMEMLLELGIVGFLVYVCFIFVILRRTFKYSHCSDSLIKNSVIAAASAMSGIILIGFFEYCWFYPRVMFAFFVCVGVGMAAVRLAKSERNEKDEKNGIQQ